MGMQSRAYLGNGHGFIQAWRGCIQELPQLQVRQLVRYHAQTHVGDEVLCALCITMQSCEERMH